jgi:5'-nucleotidase
MAETRDPNGWMWTYSGKQYWPLDPRLDDVCIEDIAHGLSMLCRYAGQSTYFYSVAEHSILVSLMVPPELALEALLHDATEAYLSDVVRPFKKGLLDYKHWEHLNDEVIRERFRLPLSEHYLVKEADSNILHTEYRMLMKPFPTHLWSSIPGVFDPNVRLFLWPPAQAEIAFLNRYGALRKQSGIRNS